MIRRCMLFEKNIFSTKEVRKASTLFHCLVCDFSKMSEQLKKKYKLTLVPKVLFFDVKGRKVWQLTSTKAKPSGVAKKMLKIASSSKKLLEAMNK